MHRFIIIILCELLMAKFQLSLLPTLLVLTADCCCSVVNSVVYLHVIKAASIKSESEMLVLWCYMPANAFMQLLNVKCLFIGEALIPTDAGILDNYRVKRQLLHSW